MSIPDRISEIRNSLPEECREGFLRFVETGEADDQYVAHVKTHPTCQSAITDAFKISVDELRALVKPLREFH